MDTLKPIVCLNGCKWGIHGSNHLISKLLQGWEENIDEQVEFKHHKIFFVFDHRKFGTSSTVVFFFDHRKLGMQLVNIATVARFFLTL